LNVKVKLDIPIQEVTLTSVTEPFFQPVELSAKRSEKYPYNLDRIRT